MVRTIPLVCFLVPSSSHLREAGPVSLSLRLSWQQSLQQQCGLQPPIFSDHRRRHSRELFASSPGTSATSDAPEDNNDENRLPATPIVYKYPSFEDIVDTIKSHVTKDRSSMHPGPNASTYILEDGFLPEDRTWIQYVRKDRMYRDANVLYRPQIVEDLVQQIDELLASKRGRGLLVKGPQGVGKSYSLINLSRYLLANGTYWVTIIPDCEQWEDEKTFLRFLLESVGVDPGPARRKYKPSGLEDFKELISDIDTVLAAQGMKWVFIFDQINRIFARPPFQQVKDVGVLPFPFSIMKKVLTEGRIVSIISASANNDVSHREYHAGFDEFYHPTRFNEEEINLLYPREQMDKWDWETLDYETGRVPLYLNQWVKYSDDYTSLVYNEIQAALLKLEDEQKGRRWEYFLDSAIKCMLMLSSSNEPKYFDRKFLLVQKSDSRPYKYNISTLFPYVQGVYRSFYWDTLTEYINKNEKILVQICNDPMTSQDVRGRLFERIVITRLRKNSWHTEVLKKILEDAKITIDQYLQEEFQQPAEETLLTDSKYPDGTSLVVKTRTTYFIPTTDNFPAVDLIISAGKIVIAMQIHVSDSHKEKLTLLKTSIKKAGWTKEQVQKVILVYLSPKEDTTRKIEAKIGKETPTSEDDWIISRFYSKDDFDGLASIIWNISTWVV